jgi:hypothetical protein
MKEWEDALRIMKESEIDAAKDLKISIDLTPSNNEYINGMDYIGNDSNDKNFLQSNSTENYYSYTSDISTCKESKSHGPDDSNICISPAKIDSTDVSSSGTLSSSQRSISSDTHHVTDTNRIDEHYNLNNKTSSNGVNSSSDDSAANTVTVTDAINDYNKPRLSMFRGLKQVNGSHKGHSCFIQ